MLAHGETIHGDRMHGAGCMIAGERDRNIISGTVGCKLDQLGMGDTTAFVMVCALSGLALGSDLALPGALLAGVISDAGDRGRAEGAYFGWWNFATKLNLALAAGVALPLLAVFGYTPGVRDAEGLQALTVAYCLLPCALKACAAIALQIFIIRPNLHRKTL